MEYFGYNPSSAGAVSALLKGGGDCTEYSDLFVALCRAKGMPARTIEGYTTDTAPDKIMLGHNWSEVFFDNYGWVPFDTIYGFNNTFWYDTTSLQNPYDSALHYGIAGMDSCGNTGLISVLHSTMHLTGGLDQCISSIVFDWTPYEGWDVTTYDIFRSASGGPYSLLATVPGGQTTYNYIDNDNLVQDSVYCYAILANRAIDDTTALSNHICVVARVIREPEYSYIRKVTVDTTSGNINVVFVIDTAADAGRFELYRSTAATDFREVVSFTPADMVLNGGFLQYTYESLFRLQLVYRKIIDHITQKIFLQLQLLLQLEPLD
jgi:hypothetical protein